MVIYVESVNNITNLLLLVSNLCFLYQGHNDLLTEKCHQLIVPHVELHHQLKSLQDLFFQHQIVQSPSLAFQRIRMTRDLADDLAWKSGLVVMNLQEII